MSTNNCCTPSLGTLRIRLSGEVCEVGSVVPLQISGDNTDVEEPISEGVPFNYLFDFEFT